MIIPEENNPIRTTAKKGGTSVGSGPRPGQTNSGSFKKGENTNAARHSEYYKLSERLKRITEAKAGVMPTIETNADVLVARLWEYAMNAKH